MKLTNKQRIRLIASEIKLNPHNVSKIKKMIKEAVHTTATANCAHRVIFNKMFCPR